jgi:1-acyl-sn-glycerol-3-phosphate acyltransferase
MGILRLFYRLPWLVVHLLIGLPLTLLSIATPASAIRIGKKSLGDIMLNSWSGTTCSIFGLKRSIKSTFQAGAQLVAANHISWLDIQLMHSVSPMGFVAKGEIEKWPLAGRVAAVGDTIYHHRGSHDSSSGVVKVMCERLQQGSKVAIFPEGGILPGDGVKRFHARMFAPAIDTGIPVQPIMIRYRRDGDHFPGMTFLPGEHFMANFFRLLRQRSCTAELWVLPLIDSGGKQRRELAAEVEAAVKVAFELGNESEGEGSDGGRSVHG